MAGLSLPTPDDLVTYDQTWAAHQSGGYMDGNSAREVLAKSNLPNETLGAIWFLADADGDMRLSHLEFRVAMHVVMQVVRAGAAVPPQMPPAVLQALNPAPPPPPAPRYVPSPPSPQPQLCRAPAIPAPRPSP